MVPNRDFYREKAKLIREDILIPLSFFCRGEYTVLESLILYLKDKKSLNYYQTGELINRNERNIRSSYLTAKEKQSISTKELGFTNILVPVSIFSDRNFSALESLTVQLHDKLDLKFSQIADLLNRDQRTIWTAYSRARKKNVKN